ncbi:hypothetical protein ACFVIM_01195 [Streptomyces sp. NPDC057638]|uniref:hypothetical protein n=1 Tax=Streptomyces sp. NPDC057638 TaxID=3346190 RepID=UPI00367F6A73
MVGLGEELARRLYLNDREPDAASRLIVSVDSAYSALRQLTRYWETSRGKDDPHMSPAVTALEAALWTGRAARVHIILDGMPATSVLGAAPHELFGTVILAQVTASTWQRLAPLAGPRRSRARTRAAATPPTSASRLLAGGAETVERVMRDTGLWTAFRPSAGDASGPIRPALRRASEPRGLA